MNAIANDVLPPVGPTPVRTSEDPRGELGSEPGRIPHFIEVRDLVVRYGPKTVVKGVSFGIARGEQLSLLGPSGCGKTTTLRCISGLETPVSGEILIDGQVMFSSSAGINVPTERRQLSLMFQSYAIWPHMTVAQNVGYSLKLRKVNRKERAARVNEVLTMVGMADHADVPATKLSGGQQQRVALARSYAHPPKALLLDEPLSNLDARLRDQMREDLKRFQRTSGVTTIYVTHDQEEAMALSDRIIVMREGVIVQDAPPLQVYQSPRTRFVANFIGAANIIGGDVTSTPAGPALDLGSALVHFRDDGAVRSGTRAEAAVRTVHPRVTRQPPEATTNVWPARVRQSTLLGDFVDLLVDWPGGELRVKSVSLDPFDDAERVYLHLPPENVVLLHEEDAA